MIELKLALIVVWLWALITAVLPIHASLPPKQRNKAVAIHFVIILVLTFLVALIL